MHLDRYFPTPIWWMDTELDLTKLLELYKFLEDDDPEGRALSNFGGWQSIDFLPSDFEASKEFAYMVEHYANDCLQDYGLNTERFQPKINNMWFSNNKGGDFNQVHIHGGCFIAGTFYIKVPKMKNGDGEIIFYRNHFEEHFLASVTGQYDNYTPLSGVTARYPPKANRLIMFPSYVPHGVLPSGSTEDRISLSFNIRVEERV